MKYRTRSQVKAEVGRKFKRLQEVEIVLGASGLTEDQRKRLGLERKALERRLESLGESLVS